MVLVIEQASKGGAGHPLLKHHIYEGAYEACLSCICAAFGLRTIYDHISPQQFIYYAVQSSLDMRIHDKWIFQEVHGILGNEFVMFKAVSISG